MRELTKYLLESFDQSRSYELDQETIQETSLIISLLRRMGFVVKGPFDFFAHNHLYYRKFINYYVVYRCQEGESEDEGKENMRRLINPLMNRFGYDISNGESLYSRIHHQSVHGHGYVATLFRMVIDRGQLNT